MRLAFIGTGWVTSQHLTAMAGSPGIDIVAIAGRDQAKAAALADPLRIPAHADWREMLRLARPDAVYICLAPHAAAEVAVGCAGRVGAIMVEKPVASSVRAAEEALRALDAAGTIAGAAFHNRARSMVARIRALCLRQPPIVADAWWHGGMPGPRWWRTRSQSGGQMTEQCIHLVDLLRVWLGEAAAVFAMSAQGVMASEVDGFDVDDAVTATVRFASGALASVHTSCIARPGQERDGVGMVLRARGWEAHLSGWSLDARISTPDGAEEVIPAEPDIFQVQATRFRAAVEAGDAGLLPCSYAEAVASLRLTSAIHASAASGTTIGL